MLDIVSQITQSAADGLLYGAIYALAALGLSLIFSVLGVLNLAHGDFIMLGGFIGFLIAGSFSVSEHGLLAIFAIFFGAFALIGLLGAFYELAFIRIVLKRPSSEVLISSILVTVGTAFVIENIGYIYIPSFIPFQLSLFSIPINAAQLTVDYNGFFIDGAKVLALIIISSTTAMLYFISRWTYLGRAMRAIAQNRESTILMGVNPQKISLFTFALGSGFGGLAGVSIALTNSLDPGFGITYTISLLSVMVLGGTRSYWGPLAGGLIIGFVQVFIQAPFLNPLRIPFTTFQILDLGYWSPAIAILVLIIAMMIRPSGLSGRSRGTKL